MPDQNITCVTCGRRFPWTEGEQRYYARRGLSAPTHCPICRSQRAEGAAPARTGQGGKPHRNPTVLFGLVGVALALAVMGLLLWQIEAISPLLAWLLAISAIAFLVYAYDKLTAKLGRGRVPELVLLALAAIGGSPGALLAMLLLRHKTAKPSFRLPFWVIVVLQLLIVGIYLGLTLRK